MPRNLLYADLLDKDMAWLLTINFGGQIVRLSTQPVTMYDGDEPLWFGGGLDSVDFEDAVRGLSDDPELLSIPIEVMFPRDVDVARMVSHGHQLSAATAELAVATQGSTWDQRRVIITGTVTQPQYGGGDEPVSFSVEEQPYSDRVQIPDAGAVLTEDRFGDQGLSGHTGIDPEYVGQYGPIVFGLPGKWVSSSGNDAVTSGSMGVPILRDAGGYVARVLVASHRIVAKRYVGGYVTNRVRVWDSSGANGDYWNVFNAVDDLGRWYAYAQAPISTTVDKLDTEFRIGWGDGPALLGDEGDLLTGDGAPRGAGDLLLWFLRRSSLRVDRGRWAAASAYLNQYKLSGYIDEAVTPWQYIQDNILPLLPLSIRSGPDGLYPVVWKWEATARDAVAQVVAGEGVVRASPVTYSRAPSEVINEIRLEYVLRASTGETKKTTVLTGDPDPDDSSQWTNHYAQVSLRRYGVGTKSIDTDIVYEDATAHRICLWQLYVYGGIPREVSYQVGREWAWLEPGQAVALTDSEIYLDEQVALVESIKWSDGSHELKLILLDRPVRDGFTA